MQQEVADQTEPAPLHRGYPEAVAHAAGIMGVDASSGGQLRGAAALLA